MIIKITMVSGKVYKFENKKYKYIEDWIKGNFKGEQATWFKISDDVNFVININNIETIGEENE
jgi:poly-beta-hydroxyalkanoate depolymerase